MWSTSKTNVEYKQKQCGVQPDRFSLQRNICLLSVGVLEELSSAASFRSGNTRGQGIYMSRSVRVIFTVASCRRKMLLSFQCNF
jgi:hypothetical protein